MTDITYEPSITEEEVLLVVAQERRVNSRLVCERTRFEKDAVDDALQTLASHGWIDEITDDLYEFVDDPRSPGARISGIPDPNEKTQTAPIDPTEGDQEDA